MIEAKRAPVRPRVLPLQSTTPLLLDEEVQSFLESGACGNIAILGPAGSGKTTALEHLAATLPFGSRVVLLDEPQASQILDAPDSLVIYTSQAKLPEMKRLAEYDSGLPKYLIEQVRLDIFGRFGD